MVILVHLFKQKMDDVHFTFLYALHMWLLPVVQLDLNSQLNVEEYEIIQNALRFH